MSRAIHAFGNHHPTSEKESGDFLSLVADKLPSRVRRIEHLQSKAIPELGRRALRHFVRMPQATLSVDRVTMISGNAYTVGHWSPVDEQLEVSVPIVRLPGWTTRHTSNNYYGQLAKKSAELGFHTYTISHPQNYREVPLIDRALDAAAIGQAISTESNLDHTQQISAGYSLGSMNSAIQAAIDHSSAIDRFPHVRALVMNRPAFYNPGNVPREFARAGQLITSELPAIIAMGKESPRNLARGAAVFSLTPRHIAQQAIGLAGFADGTAGTAFRSMSPSIEGWLAEGERDFFNQDFAYTRYAEGAYPNIEKAPDRGTLSSHLGNASLRGVAFEIDYFARLAVALREQPSAPRYRPSA